MVPEEIAEFRLAVASSDWHEQVDAICDIQVLTTNQIATENASSNDIFEITSIGELGDAISNVYKFGKDNGIVLSSI